MKRRMVASSSSLNVSEHADAVAGDRPVELFRNAAGLGRRLDDHLAAILLAALARQQAARLEAVYQGGHRGRRQSDRGGDGAGGLRAAMQKSKAAPLSPVEAQPLANRFVIMLRLVLPAHDRAADLAEHFRTPAA